MRKAFKIILAVVVAILVLFGAFTALIFGDLAAFTATGSRTLSPSGASTGNALVVYDPGLSGAATKVATKIAQDLQSSGYTVTLAGISSHAASNVADKSIVVVGGPVYAGALTGSVKNYLSKLPSKLTVAPDNVGVFGSGQGPTSPSDVSAIKDSAPQLKDGGSLSQAIVVKIGQTENLDSRASDLVAQVTM